MTLKLTKKLIDSFEFDSSASKDIRWDSEITGLGFRLYESGKKAFVLSYRQDGTKRLYTIGQYGKITLDQARELARKRLGEVADGKDPLLERRAHRKKHEWTVRKAFTDFLKRYAKVRNEYWEETERIFKKDVLPAIGRKPIDEVTKEDVIKILDKVMARGSRIMANRTLAAIRKFFNWCIERDLIKFSPAFKISSPAKNVSRDRVLADYDLVHIWKVSGEMGYPFGCLVRFLMLTGQRRGETVMMEWGHYDAQKQVWVIPRENTKTDRQHVIQVPDMAAHVLGDCLKLGEYVFTSSGAKPYENVSRGKADLDQRLKKLRKQEGMVVISPWKLHDLRRTVASGMARLGVAPHVIEKVLNHTSGVISGVAAVYNRHQYTKEMGEALKLWETHMLEILDDVDHLEENVSVVNIPRKGKK